MGRFNGFLKSVILRVSEARDLGEFDRFGFYDHAKAYTAAPPDVLRVDEKNLREHSIPNVSGVIITTNHKTDGIHLPADDRRHFVAWSDLTKDDFDADYWARLWAWYGTGGDRHVAAYLASLDLSTFNPKAPPPKTPAFWEIVDASRAPEDAETADAIDAASSPDAITLNQIINHADADFAGWLRDRKNARRIPHRLEACGYVAVRNDGSKDGRWKVKGRNQVIYGKSRTFCEGPHHRRPQPRQLVAGQSASSEKSVIHHPPIFRHRHPEITTDPARTRVGEKIMGMENHGLHGLHGSRLNT
jgi:hypothetical protein